MQRLADRTVHFFHYLVRQTSSHYVVSVGLVSFQTALFQVDFNFSFHQEYFFVLLESSMGVTSAQAVTKVLSRYHSS